MTKSVAVVSIILALGQGGLTACGSDDSSTGTGGHGATASGGQGAAGSGGSGAAGSGGSGAAGSGGNGAAGSGGNDAAGSGGNGAAGSGGEGGTGDCTTFVESCLDGKIVTFTCEPCVMIDCDMPDFHVNCGADTCVANGETCPDAGISDAGSDDAAGDAGSD